MGTSSVSEIFLRAETMIRERGLYVLLLLGLRDTEGKTTKGLGRELNERVGVYWEEYEESRRREEEACNGER